MSVGLFLGAGASYELGMPLVWELTTELKRWLTPNKLRNLNAAWRLQGAGYPDAVIDDIARAIVLDEMHYEALLGYVQTQQQRAPSLQQDYHEIYIFLVKIVYYLLQVRHTSNAAYIDESLRCFDGILALAETNAPL